MKNITVSVDEETYRLARIRAAELDTSVSALVRNYLKSLVADRAGGPASNETSVETEAERRRRMLREVFEDFDARAVGLRMSDNLTREDCTTGPEPGPRLRQRLPPKTGTSNVGERRALCRYDVLIYAASASSQEAENSADNDHRWP